MQFNPCKFDDGEGQVYGHGMTASCPSQQLCKYESDLTNGVDIDNADTSAKTG